MKFEGGKFFSGKFSGAGEAVPTPTGPTITAPGSIDVETGAIGTEHTITAGTATANDEGSISYEFSWLVDDVEVATTAAYTPDGDDDDLTMVARWRAVETVAAVDYPTEWQTLLTVEVRHPAGSAPSIATQNWTVDDDVVSLDASAAGSGLTFTYAIAGEPGGAQINTATGLITVAGNGGAFASGDVGSGTIDVTATDQYGLTLEYEIDYTIALRAQATAANNLPDPDWTVDDDTVNVNAAADFTTNGNTLDYVITGLPTGLVDDDDGTYSGTPTVNGQSGTVTITATDEYDRETVSTHVFTTAWRAKATAASGLGPFSFSKGVAISAQNLAADFTAGGNTLSYTITGSALPSGLSVSGAGSMTGTPTTIFSTANRTVRATDEYNRTTDSTFSIGVGYAVAAPVGVSVTGLPGTVRATGNATAGMAGLRIYRNTSNNFATATLVLDTVAVTPSAAFDESAGDTDAINLITNGTFAFDNSWSKGAGWTISGGAAHKAPGSGSFLDQVLGSMAGTPTSGATIRVTVPVSGRTAGFIQLRLAGATNADSGQLSTNGTQSVSLVCPASFAQFRIFADVNFDGDLDNIQLVEQTVDSLPFGTAYFWVVPLTAGGVEGDPGSSHSVYIP